MGLGTFYPLVAPKIFPFICPLVAPQHLPIYLPGLASTGPTTNLVRASGFPAPSLPLEAPQIDYPGGAVFCQHCQPPLRMEHLRAGGPHDEAET